MGFITLVNSLVNPLSVAYEVYSASSGGSTAPVTRWVKFSPGVDLTIQQDIWNQIKEHPDVLYFLANGQIIIN